jgi:isoamylase
VDWSALAGAADPGRSGDDMSALIAALAAIRRRFPQLRPRKFTAPRNDAAPADVVWLTPQATEMTEADWNYWGAHFLAYLLRADVGAPPLYIVLNASPQMIEFRLPATLGGERWTLLLETAAEWRGETTLPAGTSAQALPRSIVVYSAHP